MNRPARHVRRQAAPPQDGDPVERNRQTEPPGLRKTEEFRTFIFLTVIMAPILAVAIVSGYGFIVWIYQMVVGPPGSGM